MWRLVFGYLTAGQECRPWWISALGPYLVAVCFCRVLTYMEPIGLIIGPPSRIVDAVSMHEPASHRFLSQRRTIWACCLRCGH